MIAGYESQQAFTKVFTEMYKLSPNKYRENEKFYPLQLKFEFEGSYEMLNSNGDTRWNITFASDGDIPCWMNLVRLVIDGFPHLNEDEYIATLKEHIKTRQALILKDGDNTVYIECIIGDVKGHSYPQGVFQTGKAYPRSYHEDNLDHANGSYIEFIGARFPYNGAMSDYSVVEIIIYDRGW